jgi:hypothetical protein
MNLNAQVCVSNVPPELLPQSSNYLWAHFVGAPPDVVIGTDIHSETWVSSLGVFPAGYTNQKILIHGKLYIDISLRLNDCVVEMAEGAEIRVFNLNELFAQRCFFYCPIFNKRWKEIKVYPGGRLVLLTCRLQAAETIINAEGSCYIRANNCLLNASWSPPGKVLTATNLWDNITPAIIRLDFRGNTVSDGPMEFVNCVVSGIGNVKTANPLPTDMNYIISSFGRDAKVFLNNSVIGIYNTDICAAKDAIDAINSTVAVGPSIPVNAAPGQANGGCRIGGVKTGIKAQSSDIKVRSSNFWNGLETNSNQIISEQPDLAQIVDVSSCSFSLTGGAGHSSSIQINKGMSSNDLIYTNVSNNYFKMPSPLSGNPFNIKSVWIKALFPSKDKTFVEKNFIEVESWQSHNFPIRIEPGNARNFYVRDDTIHFRSGNYRDNRWGICIINGFDGGGHEISRNIVRGITLPGANFRPAQCAIHIDDTRDVKLCYNTVDNTLRGIHLAGNNDSLQCKNNDIHSHYHGLHLSGSIDAPPSSPPLVVCSPQLRHGNRWLGTYDQAGADAWQYMGWQPGLFHSRFEIETNVPPLMPTVIPPSGWFEEEPGPSNHCVDLIAVPLGSTLFEVETATVVHPVEDVWRWEAKRALYLKLLQSPEILQSNNVFQTFFQTHAESAAAKLARIQFLYAEAVKIDSTREEYLFHIKQEKYALLDSLMIIGQYWLPEIQDTVYDELLAAKQIAVMEQLSDLEKEERLLKASLLAERKENVLPLIQLNNQVPTLEGYEFNEKQLLDFLLKTSIGAATAADSSIIHTIALQEVYTGGLACKKARKFLPPDLQDWALHQSEQEQPPTLHEQVLNEATLRDEMFGIAPNPAKESVRITLPLGTPGTFTIQSVTGQKQLQQHIAEDGDHILEISLIGFRSGMYFCVFRSRSGQVYSSKLIVAE